MKNFLKENWFRLGIIIIFIVLGVIFFYKNRIYLETQQNQTAERNCSQAAAMWYKNQTGSNSLGDDYTNHFNRESKKCFATRLSSLDTGVNLISLFVYDVYENRLFLERATMSSNHSNVVDTGYGKYDSSGVSTKITQKEFESLFKSYMVN